METAANAEQLNISTRIRKALDKIRPYLLADGGDVEISSFDFNTGVLSVALRGHCAGCPMSLQTLREGIERQVKVDVPEVSQVIQEGASPAPRDVAPAVKATPQTVTSTYVKSHEVVREMLKEFDAALERLSAAPARDATADLKILRRARKFLQVEFASLIKHEEQDLFPLLRSKITWGQPTVAMEQEHRTIQSFVDRLEDSILAYEMGSPGHLLGLGTQLSKMIRDHFYREENTLFFEADEIISEPTPAKTCLALTP
jgi:Fe-S cluster biogenesis protein NfuA/hemerythrin-like domain-containing protein